MLEQFLTLNVFNFLVVFARIGGAMMLLPVFSSQYMSARSRLSIAMAISFVALPMVAGTLPPPPPTAGGVVALLVAETTTGLFFGVLGQILFAALHLAGTELAFTAGIMNALVVDPVTQSQGAVVTTLLSLIGMVLVLATDLHHLMLGAVIDTYMVVPPGMAFPAGDFAELATRLLTESFRIGLQLAAPFLVFSIVFQVLMGVLARLMPQMPVFFVALPIQILFGMGLLMVVLPVLMMTFLGYYEDTFETFLTPR